MDAFNVIDNWFKNINKDDSLVDSILEMLKDENTVKADLSQLDNFERYRAVFLGQKDIESFVDKFFVDKMKNNVSGKDENKAKNYREHGNSAYMLKDFCKAFNCYSSAILYSPTNNESSELALAYGNRSAVFFELRKWENCLIDIDFAMSNGYQSYKKNRKLFFRKIECLIALNRFNEARSVLEQLPEQQNLNVDPFENDRINQFRLKLNGNKTLSEANEKVNNLSLKSVISPLQNFEPSKNFPVINSKIEIEYNEALEGRLVVKQGINIGEIIIIESPNVSVLMKNHEHSYCHHCHLNVQCKKVSMTFLPKVACDHCTNVIFCSPNCRTMAQKYHKFECPILPILHKNYMGHLAFRLLVTTKVETIREVVEAFNKKQTPLINSDSEKDFSRYMQVYQLVTPYKFDEDELLRFTVTAGILARLALYSKYTSKKSELFIGGVLLRHLLQLVTNLKFSMRYGNSTVHDDYNIKEQSIKTKDELQLNEVLKLEPISAAIFPMLSLLKISCCNPNVACVEDVPGIFIATKEVSLGNDLYINYNPNLADFNDKKRSSHVQMGNYCNCHHCELKSKDGFGEYYPIICQNNSCKATNLPLTRQTSNEKYFLCPNCKESFSEYNVLEKHSIIQDCFEIIYYYMKILGKPIIGAPLLQHSDWEHIALNRMKMKKNLKGSLEFLEEMLCKDQSEKLGKLYDKMSELYCMIGDLKASISCLEKFLAYQKETLGPGSIQYCLNMVRLCDIFYYVCETEKCNQEMKTKVRKTFESTIQLIKIYIDIYEKYSNENSDLVNLLKLFKHVSEMFNNLKKRF